MLRDGERLDLPGRRIQVVWTPGHTPGHICLYDADHNLLLTGDHLLPRITPNMGLTPYAPVSPLQGYLASLASLDGYDSAEALPAHEYRFRGIAARAAALAIHHAERADEVVAVVAAAPGLSLWQVTERLTWSRGWAEITGFMRRAALAETAAHVAYLRDEGRVSADGDGPVRSGWPRTKDYRICRAGSPTTAISPRASCCNRPSPGPPGSAFWLHQTPQDPRPAASALIPGAGRTRPRDPQRADEHRVLRVGHAVRQHPGAGRVDL